MRGKRKNSIASNANDFREKAGSKCSPAFKAISRVFSEVELCLELLLRKPQLKYQYADFA